MRQENYKEKSRGRPPIPKIRYELINFKEMSDDNSLDKLNIETLKMYLKKNLCNANIEIHADVNTDTKHLSSKYRNMIVGYITGCGFDCKVKPDSFVASGIADIHTRKN